MRARRPNDEGVAVRGDVQIYYEVHDSRGDEPTSGRPTLLLLPTWPIADLSVWRAQIHYLARHVRTVLFDPRGTGRSSKPADPAAYAVEEVVDDALAVLDAVGSARAVIAGPSRGARTAVRLAAEHADRVTGLVLMAPALELPRAGFGSSLTEETAASSRRFDELLADVQRGPVEQQRRFLAKHAQVAWSQAFTSRHVSRLVEHMVERTLDNGLDSYFVARAGTWADNSDDESACRSLSCPTLVIGGDADEVVSPDAIRLVAEWTGADLLMVEGGCHSVHAREPVLVNRTIRSFVERVGGDRPPRQNWVRAPHRPTKVLVVSSPLGLGHIRRDLAIVGELRQFRPDVEVSWLAQEPTTAVLLAAGETVHPASHWLSSEADHIDSECGEHDLHVFEAHRRMDEILVANFGVFADVTEEEHFDLVVADEAFGLDHFLHENPELKRFAFAWMTDFVGWLPTVEGGEHEAFLAADYNTEMIEQVARFRRVRDAALFVGNPIDVVPGSFGAGLPAIRDWVDANLAPVGYITAFDPSRYEDRDELRRQLGWPVGAPVCVASVGGSGVGGNLLEAVVAAHAHTARLVDGLRTVAVCGPRVDPGRLPRPQGVDVIGYTPHLAKLMAAADVSVVQGGLTTTMELTSLRRPFVYVPLRRHFEQQYHVPWRLDRYGAGRRVDYDLARNPEQLAAVVAAQIGRDTGDYAPVETDGAARAAQHLADLL